jgi:hypothetical protein
MARRRYRRERKTVRREGNREIVRTRYLDGDWIVLEDFSLVEPGPPARRQDAHPLPQSGRGRTRPEPGFRGRHHSRRRRAQRRTRGGIVAPDPSRELRRPSRELRDPEPWRL